MVYRTLVDTETVARHLDDPSFALVDCRFALEDESWGERAYVDAHIPGAVYAHLDRDLSGIKTGQNGRHPLPDVAALTETFSRWGIDGTTQVVAYGQQTDMFPARLWWLLRWLGHDAAAVLDGGFDRWRSEGQPTRTGGESRGRRQFVAHLRPGMIVDAGEVARVAGRPGWAVIDARAPERYRGDVEPIDRAAGHIPGARNHHYKENIDDRGGLLDPSRLSAAFESTLAGIPPDRVISYCGSGVSACHNLLALEHAGLHGARLYPGSWSEWSSDPKRPVEKSHD